MINLSKGGRINLSKEAPGTKKFRIGLGWDANATDTGTDFDLDVSVFLCKYDPQSNPKLVDDKHFIFYNSEIRTEDRVATFFQPGAEFPKKGMPASPCLGVVHSGDNRTGSGAGDDEVIFIDESKLAANIEEISVIVTIDCAAERKQNFGQVRNSYIQISDEASGQIIAKYPLEEDFSMETAVQVGSFYRRDGQFMFKAVGTGYNRGLGDFVKAYGGNL
ncbi:chemical-damaging agent resistance protein C (plasmid) [Burkholderia sp. SFA1]|jgi:tellurium resistance protein TerD|uniref:Stress protein n=1 Tax=Burkholderia vietnamiensis (strain G4 / LMG 22486) TaxID=269482 RepID=A4JU97_BURVG|nr:MULTISPECIES: TerD family protein [Caballeronia]ABO59850.1 stress protein [Burkholderia vietnamiensis G4]AET95337.1 stress protein [Burkholderia sp. YI23]MCB4349988.1 TerD family protein [Burkholderia vietnamiensis]BBQ02955.1 chemical-damaging agent resistance protein C [Burkholderia sp. SFA1]MDR5798941.1 TerD family protein [Caballeronia sp. LZ001]